MCDIRAEKVRLRLRIETSDLHETNKKRLKNVKILSDGPFMSRRIVLFLSSCISGENPTNHDSTSGNCYGETNPLMSCRFSFL